MDVRHLKSFVRIVEAGSISRAAIALHIAQPALSKQIRQLEEELGVDLLARSVRGVVTTQAGLAVYRHAQAVLKQLDAMPSVAAQASGGAAGPVAVGLPWTIASMLGLPLLDEVRRSLPAVRLEVSEGPSAAITQTLSQGKLDLAVVFGKAHATLRLQPLVDEPLRLVGPKGSLPGRRRRSLDEAAALPLLLMSRPNGIREELERIWSVCGLTPNVVADVNAPQLLIEAVQAGLGFGVLPSCVFDRKTSNWQVDTVKLHDNAPRRTVSLASSMLFPISPAAQRVHAILERLLLGAVREGRWDARLLGSR